MTAFDATPFAANCTTAGSSMARSSRPARQTPRRRALRGTAAGLLLGAVAAFSAVHAAPPVAPAVGSVPTVVAQAAPVSSNDPAKQLPAAVAVSNIDFKRGEGGAGRLILSFTGEGAAPDLRTQGSQVTIRIDNARLPESLEQSLNVTDFATPVDNIDARRAGSGALVVLDTSGDYESMAYQTGNQYIVEIVPQADDSRRSAAIQVDAEGDAALGAMQSADTDRAYSGRPVTFNFQDVPVRTVLQLIAEESDLNMVASDSVQGNVTLRLVNVPWDQALDIVLRAKGLAKRRNGNVVWIAPQTEIAAYEQAKADARIAMENRTELVTEYIQINYHNAEAIYKALTEAKGIGGGGGGGGAGGAANAGTGFLSPRGRIVADARTNTLMISDTPEKVAEMKELISVIDRPVDQVLIEARVVIATESFARELGAKFGVSGNDDNVYFSGDLEANEDNINADADAAEENAENFRDWLIAREDNPDLPLPNPVIGTITRGLMSNFGVAETAGSLALSILNAGYLLDVELNAMQVQGRGEVISNPRIVTSNQRQAVIRQGQEVGYVTIQPAAGGGVATPNVQFKDVLLELTVTPTITHDGRVFLDLNILKDEIEGFTETSIGDVPQISTREVNTAVLIENGQTVVIGGVYELRDREDVSKIPFLGDIPFLGRLFKNEGKTREKAELLIFVTPRVLHVDQRR